MSLVLAANGNLKLRQLNAPGSNQVLAEDRISGGITTPRWALADHEGSVRDVVADSGTVVDHIHYDSFGKIIAETTPSERTRATYTGAPMDAETGFIYLHNRYLDPSTGRFVSQDPISFAAGDENLYRYVRNNPITSRDPSGLQEVDLRTELQLQEKEHSSNPLILMDAARRRRSPWSDPVTDGELLKQHPTLFETAKRNAQHEEEYWGKYASKEAKGNQFSEQTRDMLARRSLPGVPLDFGDGHQGQVAWAAGGYGIGTKVIQQTIGAARLASLRSSVKIAAGWVHGKLANLCPDKLKKAIDLNVSIPQTAPQGFVRVFRAVSEAEYQQILRTGKFEVGPNAMEGKWFADSFERATAHGNALEGPGQFRIIQADVPNNAPSLYTHPNMDGRGPARYLHIDDLQGVAPRPVGGSQ